MRNIVIGLALGAAISLGVVACTSSGTIPNPPSAGGGGAGATYQQIELLSRPAVKEAFESFADHSITNASEPYADSTIQSDILSFSETVAGRSSTWAGALQATLYPNEMIADLSATDTKAAYLGAETGGITGSKFGGRALTDDVIGLSLGAIFGNVLTLVGVPDDGKESPCLSNDNVPAAETPSTSFPYAQAPI